MKRRVASSARRAGKSPHNFMLEAITEIVAQAEARHDFERTANERMRQLTETGRAIEWVDMRRWLEARGKGRRVAKPRAQKISG